MIVRRKNQMTGKVHEMDLPVTTEELARFAAGEHVQLVWPQLDAAYREFIRNGITPVDWRRIFRHSRKLPNEIPAKEVEPLHLVTREDYFALLIKDKEFAEWYNTRSMLTKALILLYPTAGYKVKKGAPYAITCPGSTVYINGYCGDGNVKVVLLAKNFLPETKAHIKKLAEKHGTDYEMLITRDTGAIVHPKWLELQEFHE